MKLNALLGVVLLAGCTAAQNGDVETVDGTASQQLQDVRISMERMPCFGTCPVYAVSIAGDGTVSWRGDRHVQTTGAATSKIETSAVAALVRELTEGGYFELADRYVMDAPACGLYHTDAPRATTVVTVNGRTKTVEHDFGCNGAPASLRRMQDAIDRTAGTERWIGPR